jgi:hypothetical protein
VIPIRQQAKATITISHSYFTDEIVFQACFSSSSPSHALAWSNVDALPDINLNFRFEGVSIFFAVEGFDMARTVGTVIDYPRQSWCVVG